MAKTSKVVKNEQRKEIVARYAERRKALKETIRNPQTSDADREKAFEQLRKLPRDSSRTRIRNRCAMTGRLRQFGLARITFREMALQGLIPGVKKASW